MESHSLYNFVISAGKTYEGTSEFSCVGTECTVSFEDGTIFTGRDDDGVVKFTDIPYAEPPVGDLRWKAPIIRDDFNGESLDCTEEGAACGITNEDCLFINLYVARSVMENDQKVPVLFNIHGGGLQGGDNNIDDVNNLVLDQGTG